MRIAYCLKYLDLTGRKYKSYIVKRLEIFLKNTKLSNYKRKANAKV
jgi:hypothetical protein